MTRASARGIGRPVGDGSPTGRAQAFGVAAEAYDRYRPQPAPEAVDWLLRAGDQNVVDVGAGTGQLTRLLVERAAEVTAVEPDPAMRRVLTLGVPQARVAAGVAERMPLRSGSQDAVVSHAAWHWFDRPESVREAVRVLRPRGRLGALATGFDPTLEWLDELWERLEPDPNARPTARRTRRERVLAPVERARSARLFGAFGASFERQERHVVRFSREFTNAELLGLMGTYGGLLARPPHERTVILDRARDRLDALVPRRSDAIELPMLTRCWRADRRA